MVVHWKGEGGRCQYDLVVLLPWEVSVEQGNKVEVQELGCWAGKEGDGASGDSLPRPLASKYQTTKRVQL